MDCSDIPGCYEGLELGPDDFLGVVAWGFLCDVVHEADAELPRYDRETAWDNPRFVAVLKARARADEQLNQMWETKYGST